MGNLPWGSIPLLDSYLDLQVFREYWDKKRGGEHGQRFWTRLWKSKFVLFTSRGNDVCVDGVGGRVSKFLSCSSYQKYRFWSAPEKEKYYLFQLNPYSFEKSVHVTAQKVIMLLIISPQTKSNPSPSCLFQTREFWKNMPTKNNKMLYPERFYKCHLPGCIDMFQQ